jgi:hypothetical protein
MAFSIDTLTALTQKYIAPRVVDSTFKGSPFAYWLKEEGRLSLKGGRSITQPIIKAQLNNEMYDGLDASTIEQLEPFTSAEFNWKWGRIPFAIAETDIDKNGGPEGVVDLAEATEETAKLTAIELLSTNLFGTNASASKNFDGLQDMAIASGTSYGGLLDTDFVSPATWLMAIHTLLSAGALTTKDMRLMRGKATRGQARPNMGLCNFPTYAKINDLAQTAQRFGSERLARLSFDHVMFEDMPIMPDEHSTGSGTGTADNFLYFLNTDYIKLVIHENKAFVSRVYAPIFQQEVFLGKILFGGNLITSQRRAHSVTKTINPTT